MVLGWYDEIVAAVDRVSVGGEIGPAAGEAFDALGGHVGATIDRGDGVLAEATSTLAPAEVVSNAAVMMFGGIETSEGLTTIALLAPAHEPRPAGGPPRGSIARRQRGGGIAAARARRRQGRPVRDRRDRARRRRRSRGVTSSSSRLTAANRDPATFPEPDEFDISRPNARSHVAFAQGPHACVGIHLARLETQAALEAALDGWPGIELETGALPPTGVIFRKPRSLPVRWDPLPAR